MAGDPEQPRDSLVVAVAAELVAMRERFGEGLRDEIDRDLGLQRPARDVPQENRGVRLVQPRDRVRIKGHAFASTYRGTTPTKRDRGIARRSDSAAPPSQTALCARAALSRNKGGDAHLSRRRC